MQEQVLSSATVGKSFIHAALWSRAFRPFFLAASLWAALAVALWIVLFATGVSLPSRFDPLTWHIHAMLFGFVLAAIAGFMLTAIPIWTGRPAIHDTPLMGLAALWLIGRIACFVSAFLPFWLAAALDLTFPVLLCAVAAREIIAARSWSNVAMPIPIGVLGIADLLMYLEQAGFDVPAGLGWRLAIMAIVALISAIGGRIIPVFTRNWLTKRGTSKLPAARGKIDRFALATLHSGLLGWVFFPLSQIAGVLLITGAALNLWRLARWHGLTTLPNPLLAVLHLGYGWAVAGAALLGASMLTQAVPTVAAIHALTAGAIGTMVLAVMTRVSLGHTGRALRAGPITKLIFVTITLAAATRVAAGFLPAASMGLLIASATLWVVSFGLFAASYGAMLLSPRISS